MSPYRIEPPFIFQFSGGRTSAFMLFHVLQAWGGTLPDGAHVLFENTGKERPETLDFVRDCAERWGVRVRWLEWMIPTMPDGSEAPPPEQGGIVTREKPIGPLFPGMKTPAMVRTRAARRDLTNRFREVDYSTASRAGEPFEKLVRWTGMLPNPKLKICTERLKIDVAEAFVETLGWEEWTTVVGIRFDEPRRFGSLGQDAYNPREYKAAPLVDARVTVADVMAFWSASPFDLQLEQHEGNCDLCPFKSISKRLRIMRARPDLATWWIRQEEEMQAIARTPGGARFKLQDPPVWALLKRALGTDPMFPEDDGDGVPCGCAG